MTRQSWITPSDLLAVTRQCLLADVSRATFYVHQKPRLIGFRLAIHF